MSNHNRKKMATHPLTQVMGEMHATILAIKAQQDQVCAVIAEDTGVPLGFIIKACREASEALQND